MTVISQRPQAWGSRSQIGGTVAELKDLLGNKDGIWGNESEKPGTIGNLFERNPLALKAQLAARTGISTVDEIKLLNDFVGAREAAWGKPVMDPAVKAELNGGDLFAAQKAIALVRYGRDPSDVTERFVSASGTVNGKQLDEPTRVFTQHFRPIGEPTGDVVVMSPGFLESGRAFLEEVDRLCLAGAYVVVMDHQWAGHTQGKKGGIVSGESIALHTAAVVADAAKIGRELYGDALHIAVVGESMGGGPGALGASLMSRAGKLSLDGVDPQDNPFVTGVDLFLQAPYLAPTDSFINNALGFAAGLPFVNKLAMPGAGVPDFVDDPRGEHLVAQGMVMDDIRGQTQAFKASDGFIADVQQQLAAGTRTGGFVFLVHDEKDPLAKFGKSVELEQTLGKDAKLIKLDGGDHGLSASDPDVIEHLISHMRQRRSAE